MEITDIANILADAWVRLTEKPEWNTFIQYNDLGLPLSFGVANGLVLELSAEGESLLRETYDMLCDVTKVNKDAIYFTLDELLADADWDSE